MFLVANPTGGLRDLKSESGGEAREMAESKLEETLRLAKELQEQSKLGITRIDYVFTMVNALCELHPEIYRQPKVEEFMEKMRGYKEHARH